MQLKLVVELTSAAISARGKNFFPLFLLLFYFHIFARGGDKMSGWALNCCFLSVSPQKCDSRVPLPLCHGVGRESPAGLGEKAADTERWQSHATMLPRDEADKLNLAGGCILFSVATCCARQSSFQGSPRGAGLWREWTESQCPAAGLLQCLLGSPQEQLGLGVPSRLWWRKEAPSQLRDVEEARRKPPRGKPFSLSSCQQDCQAPPSPQGQVGSCVREISSGEEQKRVRFPWLSACGMQGCSPTARLCSPQPVAVKEAAGARGPLGH